MDIHFETIGCRLNQIESESAARFFSDNGFSVSMSPFTAKTPKDDGAYLCVINTCAVTQKAEQKDRRIIRLILEKLPSSCVVVTGCYAQLSKDDINAMDKRIACLPGQTKNRLLGVSAELKKALEENSFDAISFASLLREKLFLPPQKNKGYSEDAFSLSTDSFLNHSRASIKIQDGCDFSCSYCAIHSARGRSVSLDATVVLERIKLLEKAGQNEVVFTTVNIAQYKGFYNGDYIDFPHLLQLCIKNTKNISFRISSLYPDIVDEYFCEVIKNKRVRPHFHMSIQSGSEKILKAMCRPYRPCDMEKACAMLRNAKKDAFLACDIITGFPGETDEDFEATLELCKKCDFSWVHVFPFSARPKTAAKNMKNQVPAEKSSERAAILSGWASENKKKYIESCSGKVFDAILENVKKNVFYTAEKGKIFHAVTENFLHCEILGKPQNSLLKQGDIVKVRILNPVCNDMKKGGEIDCIAEFA